MEGARLTAELTTVSREVATCGMVFGSLCMLSALFGNSLIIAAVTREPSLRQRQNVFLVSWAASEIVMVFARDLFVLLVYAVGEWRFGRTLSLVNLLFFMARNSFAINHVVVITLYRYALIVHPKAYRAVSRTPVLVAVVAFVFASPVALMLTLDVDIYSKPYAFVTKGMYAMKEENGTLANVPPSTTATGFLTLVLSCIVLVACYVHIYVFIRSSSRRVGGWTRERAEPEPGSSSAAGSTPGGAAGNPKAKSAMKRNLREKKFVRTMIIIFVAFVFSYFSLPLMLMADKTFSLSHWAYMPLVMMNWFSSSVTWIMYGLTHDGFRKAFLRLLRCPSNSVGVPDRSSTGRTADS